MGGDAARCYQLDFSDLLAGGKKIVFSTRLNKHTAKEIESVTYHELTHCLCNVRDHDDRKLPDGCPASMMNTYTLADACLVKHEKLYKRDIKLKCQKGKL